MKLDENKIYYLEELTSEELQEIYNATFFYSKRRYNFLYFEKQQWHYTLNYFTNKHKTNAKELFYTLENVQVDCSNETQERIKEMCKVFEIKGYRYYKNKSYALKQYDDYIFLQHDKDGFLIDTKDEEKTTITYEKFMELFGKKEHFKQLVEVLNEELTEEAEYEVKYIAEKPLHYAKGIDTFARMEANCTTEECLAFAKGNIDKYNFRTKGQDLEDYKKIVSYANWAISLLNKA